MKSTIGKDTAQALMGMFTGEPRDFARIMLDAMASTVHASNVMAGWWSDPATGEMKDRNVGEMLALIHSEISEALEGHRKGLMDDKLPHRKMFAVELADTIIRVLDLAGADGIPIGTIVMEKMAYNATRESQSNTAR
jgi:ligand-binding sensor domain-containing protein